MLKEAVFNGLKLIRNFRFRFSPYFKVSSEIRFFFLVESSASRFLPTLLRNFMEIIFKQPPFFKTEWFLDFGREYSRRARIGA